MNRGRGSPPPRRPPPKTGLRRKNAAAPVDLPEEILEVRGDHITLGQLLKVTGAIEMGSRARDYLSAHAVMVNGEPEQRRGRKLFPGDRVQIAGGTLLLAADSSEGALPAT